MKQEAEPGKQIELEGNIARAAAKEVEYGMNHPFVNEGGRVKRDERDYCPKEMKMEGSCPLGHRCDVSILLIRTYEFETIFRDENSIYGHLGIFTQNVLLVRCSDENFSFTHSSRTK